jgi:hypothetical protein
LIPFRSSRSDDHVPKGPAKGYEGVVRRHPGSFPPRDAAAFAEGRRLREQSRRPQSRQPPRRSGQLPGRPPGLPPRPVGLTPALMLLCWMVALGEVGRAAHGAVGFVGPTPLLLIGVVALLAAGGGRHALARPGPGALAPPPAAAVPRPRPDLVWAGDRDRFHRLRADYAAFECDPMRVLRLPALADVSVPSTARFVDAFAEAQALESDHFPGAGHAERFGAAVGRAERAWHAATGAAERIRLSALTPAERATVERVIKLLTTARDSDSEPERLAAYTRARTELTKLDQAGVVHVPLPAQAALDEAGRGQLPS